MLAQAPLRLRTGVLLYGPPGCGKTHIVAAAVAAAGVRCITVRCALAGPLLRGGSAQPAGHKVVACCFLWPLWGVGPAKPSPCWCPCNVTVHVRFLDC